MSHGSVKTPYGGIIFRSGEREWFPGSVEEFRTAKARDELMISDSDLLSWLEDEIVDTICMDDGTIINVKGSSLRGALHAAYDAAHQEEN